MYISIMDSGDMNQTFTATATAAGVDYTNSTTVYVLHQIYASIGIQAFKVSPGTKDNQPKDSSQSYTATITLKNSGEKAGKVQLMLLDNLKIVANQSASVDAGASKDVKVTFSIKGSGTHTIRAVVTGDIDYANMTKTAKCTLNYQPGFEVVVLVAAVLVAAVLVRRRKD
jgi:PGF-CTERM protein